MFDGPLDEIEDLLRSSESEERKEGLAFVGENRCFELTHLVVDLTLDRDKEVKRIAKWALSRIKSPETVPQLIAALTHPSLEICTNAGWLLIEIAQSTVPNVVVPDLIELLFESEDSLVRQMAYVVLGEIPSIEAMEAVEEYRKGRS